VAALAFVLAAGVDVVGGAPLAVGLVLINDGVGNLNAMVVSPNRLIKPTLNLLALLKRKKNRGTKLD
jgi:hypothetical protein